MADIKTANLAKLVSKQAGRAKEKVRPNSTFLRHLRPILSLEKGTTCADIALGKNNLRRFLPTPTFTIIVGRLVAKARRK